MDADKGLIYSATNWEETLKAFKPIKDNTSKLALDPFPDVKVLAAFAKLSYSDCAGQLDLPEGWQLLTTARNNSYGNGYFGCAFLNPSEQQVAIAHRGTDPKNVGALWADGKSVYFTGYTEHMFSAITFADRIKEAILKIKKQHAEGRYVLSICGHSLGGWLAGVTALTVKHLKRKGSGFCKTVNPREGIHAHTLVLDGPGVRDMLIKLCANYDVGYDRSMSTKYLDITTILAAPNAVNSTGFHVGDLQQIYTKRVALPSDSKKPTMMTNIDTHSLDKFIDAIKEGKETYTVKNWPRGWTDRKYFHLHEFICNSYFLHLLPDPDPENVPTAESSGSHRNAESEEEITGENLEETQTLQYKTIKSLGDTCHLGVFTLEELSFIQNWRLFHSNPLIKLTEIEKFFSQKKLKKLDVPKFEIDTRRNTITCKSKENLKNLIGLTKQLLRWFPKDITDAVRKQNKSIESGPLYMAGQGYLRTLPDIVDCVDSLGIQTFLEASEQRVLQIESGDLKFEAARINNILIQIKNTPLNEKYLKENNHIFLCWNDLARIAQNVDIEALNKSNVTIDNLLVLEFDSSNNDYSSDDILSRILNNLETCIHKKLIVIIREPIDSEFLMNFNLTIETKPFKVFELSDLAPASIEEILERDAIALGEKNLSLNKLLGNDYTCDDEHVRKKIDKLISPILNNLTTDPQYTAKIPNNLPRFWKLDAFYSKGSKVVSKEKLIKLLEKSGAGGPLVVISDPDQLSQDYWGEEAEAVQVRIFTTDEDGQNLFLQKCQEKSDRVIYWLHLCTEGLTLGEVYNSSLYMPRKFHARFIIKSMDAFVRYSGNKDIFIFKNVENKSGLINAFNLSSEAEGLFVSQDHFQIPTHSLEIEFQDNEKSFNKHYFKLLVIRGSPCLVWLYSHGSLDGLRPFITRDNTDPIEEGDFSNTEKKLTIIADDPGMGKTTILTRISELIRGSWVLRIEQNHLNAIDKLPSKFNLQSVAKCLILPSGLPTDDNLPRNLLQHCLETDSSWQVCILVDAFDEITKEKTKVKLVELLKYLKNTTTCKTIVTTRVYPQEELENGFGEFSAEMVKITETEQDDYMMKSWLPHLALELPEHGELEKGRLRQFASELRVEVMGVLGEDVASFMGIPLQIRMLAEVFLNQAVQSVVSPEQAQNSSKITNLSDLYKQFLEVKKSIYFEQKTNLNKDLPPTIQNQLVRNMMEHHCVLAFQSLDPKFAAEYFTNTIISSQDLKDISRLGIIRANIDGTFPFIHRTFEEYFCADFFVQWLRQGRTKEDNILIKNKLCNLLHRPEYYLIRMFIETQLDTSPPITSDTLEKNLMLYKSWSEHRQLFFNDRDKTPLHIAAEEQNLHTVAVLLSGPSSRISEEAFVSFVAARDKAGRTALNIALENENRNIENEITKNVKNCSYESLLEIMLSTFINMGGESDDHLFGEYCSKTQPLTSVNMALMRTEQIRRQITPFMAAVREDDYRTVLEIYGGMASDTERTYLLIAFDSQGDTAINLAASKKDNLLFKIFAKQGVCMSFDKFEQNPVHCAAREGHTGIVKYLLNQSKETYDSIKTINNDKYSDEEETAIQYAGKNKIFFSINSKQHKGCTALLLAASRGHNNIVRELLEKGADVHLRNSIGNCALSSAALYGHTEVVELLLLKAADVNSQNKKGYSALIVATLEGHLDTVRKLLEKGADVHTRDSKGNCALNYAALYGHTEVVELLLLKGADVNSQNEEGNSALIAATIKGHLDTVRKLLEKGADVHTRDRDGDCALNYVAHFGHKEVVELLLLKAADVNSQNKKGYSALIVATLEGHLDTVRKLLEKGADVHTRDSEGNCALNYAALYGHTEVVELLLLKGADVNSQNEEGNSALIAATIKGHLDTVRKLLEKGADLHTRNSYGICALNSAALYGHTEVVELLLLKGADVNSQNEKGYSTLIMAAIKGNLDTVRKLLEKGADVHTRDREGDCALNSAAIYGYTEVVELLLLKGADVNSQNEKGYSALIIATIEGHLDTVRKLLEKGADVHTRDSEGNCALNKAALYGHTEVVDFLLLKGADVNSQNEKGYSALIMAAIKGNLDTVRKLLEKGADVHTRDREGDCALNSAAIYGHTDVVELLLLKGADVNSQNEKGYSALIMAAIKGNLDMVRKLLEKGADVHTRDSEGDCALNKAAHYGYTEVVELLLLKGADVNSQNEKGYSALIMAAIKGNLDTVRKLLEKGADVHTRDRDGDCALNYVAHFGHKEVVELLLLKGAEVNSQNEKGDSALIMAAIKGNLDTVRKLLEKGADVHTRDSEGNCALNKAALYGHTEVVDFLLLKGADVNSQNEKGYSALIMAAIKGNLDTVRKLLEKGADVHARDRDGDCALNSAAIYGHTEVVELLLLKGAEVNSQNEKGYSALIMAAIKGNLDTIRKLLEKGADVHTRDRDGDCALNSAAIYGHTEVVELLLMKAADVNSQNEKGNSALIAATIEGHFDTVRKLLEKGADVHTRDSEGNCALNKAALYGHTEVVNFLLLKGADVNSQNETGESALIQAAAGGDLDMVRKLLEKGANVHSRNSNGDCALNYAAHFGHKEVVELLLLKGADVNFKNEKDESALMYAAKNGHLDTVGKLLEKGANIHTRNTVGWTAFNYAAIFGLLEVAKLLLLNEADLNSRDINGDTALLHASAFGRTKIVVFLLQRGVDVNIQRDDGRTALSWAALKGNGKVVEILLQYNADVSCQDKDGKTALSWAEEKGHGEVVDLLRSHQEANPSDSPLP